MKDLENKIELIEMEMQFLTNKAYSYSQYGRYPDENDWVEIIKLLQEWNNKRYQSIILKELLEESSNNSKYAGG